MNRYVVLDTGWVDEEAVTISSWTGHTLDSFRTYDSAKALALQRIAYGDLTVMVVDRKTGERVFPAAESESDHEHRPGSEMRPAVAPGIRATRAARKERAG
jgi:hypothetical protein